MGKFVVGLLLGVGALAWPTPAWAQAPPPASDAARAQARYDAAAAFFKEKKFTEAEQALLEATQFNPNFNAAFWDLGSLYLTQGRYDQALAQFKKVADRMQDAESHYRYGVALYKAGQTTPAINELIESLRQKEDNVGARKDLGLILLNQGRMMEAATLYARTVELRPNDADSYNDYGVVLMRLGESGEAAARFRKALELKADHADAQYNLALSLFNSWNLQEAVKNYQGAIKVRPDYTDAYYNLGRTYMRLNQLDDANAQFARVIELNPNYTDAYYQWGLSLKRQGQVREAIPKLAEALRHNPSHVDAQYELGVSMANAGRFSQAMPHFLGVLRGRPDSPDGHYQLARCLSKLGRTEEAVAHYREALWLRPDWHECQNDLAWLHATHPDAKFRDAARSLEIADSAYQRMRNIWPLVTDTLAAAYAEGGKFDEAVKLQQQTIAWAKALGDERLVAEVSPRLPLYQKKQPYRLPPPADDKAKK